MKQLCARIGLLSIFCLTIPFVLPMTRPVSAAFIEPSEVTASVSTPTPVPSKVEYTLPYPGLLPDNAFYILKNFRDSIIEMLISDPINKAEFYVLQADKKVSMGLMLSGMGKSKDALDVMDQAMTMRTKAVTTLENATKAGSKVPAFVVEKLKLSIEKHQEVLNDMKLSVTAIAALLTKAQSFTPQIK